MSNLELTVKGTGFRKDLADALRILANALYSEELEEIYNIDGAAYNDMAIEVILKDKDND